MKKLILLSGLLLLLTACSSNRQLQPVFKENIQAQELVKTTVTSPLDQQYDTLLAAAIPFQLDSVENINTYMENTPNHVSVRYPNTASEEINKKLSQWASTKIKDFYKIARKNKEIASELNITYETYNYNDNIVSFKFNIYTSYDGKTGMNNIDTMTFDLDTGNQFYLNKISKGREEYLKQISDDVRQYITEKGLMDEVLDPIQFEQGTKPIAKNYESFVLTDGNILFLLDQNQIGKLKSTDMLEVPLPIDEIISLYQTTYPEINFLKESIVAKEEEKNYKYVAITFDDGPHPQHTPYLLDELKRLDAKATFFMLGQRAEFNPDIIKRMKEDGHELGNHSYDHKELTKIGIPQIKQEMDSTNRAIFNAVNEYASVLRPPYGSTNATVFKIAQDRSLPVILWNIDPLDWKIKDAKKVCDNIVSKAKNGDIILVHDIYDTSVKGAVMAIEQLQAQGFKFVTVSELIAKDPALDKTKPIGHVSLADPKTE